MFINRLANPHCRRYVCAKVLIATLRIATRDCGLSGEYEASGRLQTRQARVQARSQTAGGENRRAEDDTGIGGGFDISLVGVCKTVDVCVGA